MDLTGSNFVLFNAPSGVGLFVVEGSRVYVVSDRTAELLAWAERAGRSEVTEAFLGSLERASHAYQPVSAPTSPAPKIRAISLAVAQACNLGCTYCYAQGGHFGGRPRNMTKEVAFAAIDRLVEGIGPGDRAAIAFLGGEPLINRELILRATAYARSRAQAAGAAIGFSLTTNGTLLAPRDADFFAENDFTITVSLDGIGDMHDKQRPFANGRGSFERIIERIAPLFEVKPALSVAARVTITPRNLSVKETVSGLIDLGFASVGVSPVLQASRKREEMTAADLDVMLSQMKSCGEVFRERLDAGESFPFSNLVTSLQQLHRGTVQHFPCGAGTNYFGISADGEISACHRFVGDDAGYLGSVETGFDSEKLIAWKVERDVSAQPVCRSCWARSLCGGGCHHEVIHRGRPACDYIRGWLAYCLETYIWVMDRHPHFLGWA